MNEYNTTGRICIYNEKKKGKERNYFSIRNLFFIRLLNHARVRAWN